MREILKNALFVILILLVILIAFFFGKYYQRPEKPTTITKIDTVKVKADTVYKNKSYAVMLSGKIDTIIVNDTIKSIIARADTLIQKDSSFIRIAYYFPPENYFDVDMNIKEKIVTITRDIMKYVETENPWYDHFWIGALSTLAFVISIILLK